MEHDAPPARIEVEAIGVVRCRERDVRRRDWARVRSEIALRPELAEALDGLEGFSHVIVVGWLDRIPDELRTRLRARPGGDAQVRLCRARHASRKLHPSAAIIQWRRRLQAQPASRLAARVYDRSLALVFGLRP